MVGINWEKTRGKEKRSVFGLTRAICQKILEEGHFEYSFENEGIHKIA